MNHLTEQEKRNVILGLEKQAGQMATMNERFEEIEQARQTTDLIERVRKTHQQEQVRIMRYVPRVTG